MCLYFAGDVPTRGASDQMGERAPVDMVDFGPPDPYQKHVINLRPLISLVRSNGHNFISQLANCGVTHGSQWTL